MHPFVSCQDLGVMPREREWWNTILVGSLIHFQALIIISFLTFSGPGALFVANWWTALSILEGISSFIMSLVSPPSYSLWSAGWPSPGIRVSARTCKVSWGESVSSPDYDLRLLSVPWRELPRLSNLLILDKVLVPCILSQKVFHPLRLACLMSLV